MSTLKNWSCTPRALCHLVFMLCAALLAPAQTPAQSDAIEAPAAPPSTDASASNDILRAYLQLQEQLHSAQLAIDRVQQQSEASAARLQQQTEQASLRNTEVLTGQLKDLERKFSTQQAEETKFMLYVLGVFGGLSLLAVGITGFFQWRAVNRIADVAASLPVNRGLPPTAGSLGFQETALLGAGQLEESNRRLLGALDRLEKRILELERTAAPALNLGGGTGLMESAPEHNPVVLETVKPAAVETISPGDPALRIQQLMERGQACLNEDKGEAAAEQFDQVLALDPHHTEALVKKGAALEKVRKLQEAVDCYDRAIAIDPNLTIAYLYKGGLYNRLERFGEAVECYEKALRTQEKRSAA